ncbi:hypothetical protein ACF07L_24845 [Streptomyces anulatus]|uniref:hypothetical protein n=1 Tax=Streptomyces anulatus TaxID=1892 RepID=UPI0036F8AFA7
MRVRTGRRIGVSDPGSDREDHSGIGVLARTVLTMVLTSRAIGRPGRHPRQRCGPGAMVIAMGAFLLVGRLADRP